MAVSARFDAKRGVTVTALMHLATENTNDATRLVPAVLGNLRPYEANRISEKRREELLRVERLTFDALLLIEQLREPARIAVCDLPRLRVTKNVRGGTQLLPQLRTGGTCGEVPRDRYDLICVDLFALEDIAEKLVVGDMRFRHRCLFGF
jgi:hypothetical protein